MLRSSISDGSHPLHANDNHEFDHGMSSAIAATGHSNYGKLEQYN
jgi:hypothetical protein